MLKKVRKMMSDRKGFTLVELIVVLVILSVLAAMLAPTMTGYIDKAKGKRVEAELHQAVVAAQTLADEAYALAENYDGITLESIAALAELEGELQAVYLDEDNGKVAYVALELNGVSGVYTETGGIQIEEEVAAPGTGYHEVVHEEDDGDGT